MQIPFFTLDRQHLGLQSELENVYARVMEKGRFILGEEVERFESRFASFIGVDYCISCGNGTDALELILHGLGVKTGDEVIIPGNTWMSVAEAVVNVGGIPRIADMDPTSLSMDLDHINDLISEKTFAVIFVHQYGNPTDVRPLKETLSKQGVFLIEDCAHAHGATINGIKCGAMGHASAFSFYPTKNLGCLGDGGAVLTNDDKLESKLSQVKNHGQVSRDHHVVSGRNSRLDELQAGFLNEKLSHLNNWNQKRRKNANYYLSHISSDYVYLYQFENSIYHQFVITSDVRDQVTSFLLSNGISTGIHYPNSINQMELYENIDPTPKSDIFSKQALSIPVFPELNQEELDYIVETINSFQPS
ncbi:MAG: DegT/DnrJ/EryC1/StrS family aminotransferase [bacterium]|nr:DegT/DnrJ/EryC1/StrS family aminotransferase [bacterium]